MPHALNRDRFSTLKDDLQRYTNYHREEEKAEEEEEEEEKEMLGEEEEEEQRGRERERSRRRRPRPRPREDLPVGVVPEPPMTPLAPPMPVSYICYFGKLYRSVQFISGLHRNCSPGRGLGLSAH